MLVLAALWWAWGAYAWLTNYIAADEGKERLLMFAVMGAFLVAALATPHAFGDDALLFGLAYAAVRWLHIFIFAEANDDVDTGEAIMRLARTALPGPALLIAAGLTEGTVQAALWIVALAIDFAGPVAFGVRGFRVSPGHFAERFSLIVIIALGESIVAIGVGAGDHPLDAAIGTAAVLAVVASAGLWWAYFDVVAPLAGRRLGELSGAVRNTLARDAFAYLHLPMLAGIQLFALGVEQVVGHVDEALKPEAATALFGGIALYLLGHVAFRLRTAGGLNRARLLAAAGALTCVPLATELNAVAALAVACALVAALIAFETVRFASDRARVRMEA
jgi:low temperature requirement protein LtrA